MDDCQLINYRISSDGAFEKELVRLHGDPSRSLHIRQEVMGTEEEGGVRPGRGSAAERGGRCERAAS